MPLQFMAEHPLDGFVPTIPTIIRGHDAAPFGRGGLQTGTSVLLFGKHLPERVQEFPHDLGAGDGPGHGHGLLEVVGAHPRI